MNQWPTPEEVERAMLLEGRPERYPYWRDDVHVLEAELRRLRELRDVEALVKERDGWMDAAKLVQNDVERLIEMHKALIGAMVLMVERWEARNTTLATKDDAFARGASAVSVEWRADLLKLIQTAGETAIANAQAMKRGGR